jgi:predicted transcriptional regulator
MHREVTDLHPERAASQQVVRNALETLVAKGRVKRRKEQRNVTYAQNLVKTGEAPSGDHTA